MKKLKVMFQVKKHHAKLKVNVSSQYNLTYYEETSHEDNYEGFCSNQEEESDSTCSSSREYDANCEEERNDGSECSYASKGMIYFSKSKTKVPFQSCTSQLEVESCEEDLSTQYEDKEIIYKDKLPNCVAKCLEDICISNQ